MPLFLQQREVGTVTVTDPRMTRFWMTTEQGVRFVIRCIERTHGGEVFVPALPSMNIMDLVKAVAPDCAVEEIGIRPGEKLHEVLIGEDEARQTVRAEDLFVIRPAHPWWSNTNWSEGEALSEGFRYASDTNDWWLSIDDINSLVAGLQR